MAGGYWVEGGGLDTLDKRVSMAGFKLELPLVAETAFSVPGHWFGCPPFALFVLPLVLACVVDAPAAPAGQHLLVATSVIAFGMLAFWTSLLLNMLGKKESEFGSGGIMDAYNLGLGFPGVVLSVLIAPHLAALLTYLLGSREAHQAACFYLASWFFTQVAISFAKGRASRERPCAGSISHELLQVRRHFPQMQHMLMTRSGNSSFPSGDAAGAAVFAAAGLLACPQEAIAAGGALFFILCALLGGWGRVYFHAHHVLDVVVGEAMAVGVTYLLACAFTPHLHWGAMLLAHIAASLALYFEHKKGKKLV